MSNHVQCAVSPNTTTRRCLLLLLLGIIALVGTFITASFTASAAQLGGFGDPISTWQARFPQDTAGCDAANCYGQVVPHSSNRYEFSYVTTAKGRVDGFDLALSRGTSLVRAELRIAELFPGDVQMDSLTVIHHDAFGNSCAVYNLQSKILERLFGTRAFGNSHGTIGVELTRVLPSGSTRYNPNNLNLALVVPGYLGSDANC